MPRPRFERLSEKKRIRILNAAAQEFAAHGYETASLNRILETAAISKGAAYYYFDDKADLYDTTLDHCLQELAATLPQEVDHVGAERFWSHVAAFYRQQYASFSERPWILRMAKSGGRAPPEAPAEGAQAEPKVSVQGILVRIMARGQALGTVRQDLPEELLRSLAIAVDAAHDQWLYDRWADLSLSGIAAASEQVTDSLQRLLAPEVTVQRRPLLWR